MEIVTFAEIQKVKSSFEFKNSISSTRNCNEFRFFEPRFTSLTEIPHYPLTMMLRKACACSPHTKTHAHKSDQVGHYHVTYMTLVCRLRTSTLADRDPQIIRRTDDWNRLRRRTSADQNHSYSTVTDAVNPQTHSGSTLTNADRPRIRDRKSVV